MNREKDILKLLDRGEPGKARKLLDTTAEEIPRTKRLYLEGLILEEEGDLTRALERYDMALVLHLSDPRIWYSKARVLEALGRMEMAERTIERAVKLDPGEGCYRYLKGKILFDMSRFEEAKGEVEQALESGERSTEVFTLLGILISIIDQDFKRALSYFDHAIDKDPRNHKAWTNRGIALKQIGDREGAIYSFQKGLIYNPGDKNAREMLEKMGETGVIEAAERKRIRTKPKEGKSKVERPRKVQKKGETRKKKTKKRRKKRQDSFELSCPKCGTVFELPDRPGIKFKCPECGMKGRIK